MDAHYHGNLTLVADAVVIDLQANAIRIRVPGFTGESGLSRPAVLDVGANGRLIGLEGGEWYITVMDPVGADDPYARSADVLVDISPDSPTSITIPRRGDGYEITYPSGNECWQTRSVDGRLIQVCATIDAAPEALRGARGRRMSGHPRQP